MPPARTWVLRLSTAVTGALIFAIAAHTWLKILGVPVELTPPAITLDSKLEAVRPWAPWWVMPSLSALLGMILWRRHALRNGAVSWRGAIAVHAMMVPAVLIIGNLCAEFGAVLQMRPFPLIGRFLTVLPAILLACVQSIAMPLMFHGTFMLLQGAVIALVSTAIFRPLLKLCGEANLQGVEQAPGRIVNWKLDGDSPRFGRIKGHAQYQTEVTTRVTFGMRSRR